MRSKAIIASLILLTGCVQQIDIQETFERILEFWEGLVGAGIGTAYQEKSVNPVWIDSKIAKISPAPNSLLNQFYLRKFYIYIDDKFELAGGIRRGDLSLGEEIPLAGITLDGHTAVCRGICISSLGDSERIVLVFPTLDFQTLGNKEDIWFEIDATQNPFRFVVEKENGGSDVIPIAQTLKAKYTYVGDVDGDGDQDDLTPPRIARHNLGNIIRGGTSSIFVKVAIAVLQDLYDFVNHSADLIRFVLRIENPDETLDIENAKKQVDGNGVPVKSVSSPFYIQFTEPMGRVNILMNEVVPDFSQAVLAGNTEFMLGSGFSDPNNPIDDQAQIENILQFRNTKLNLGSVYDVHVLSADGYLPGVFLPGTVDQSGNPLSVYEGFISITTLLKFFMPLQRLSCTVATFFTFGLAGPYCDSLRNTEDDLGSVFVPAVPTTHTFRFRTTDLAFEDMGYWIPDHNDTRSSIQQLFENGRSNSIDIYYEQRGAFPYIPQIRNEFNPQFRLSERMVPGTKFTIVAELLNSDYQFSESANAPYPDVKIAKYFSGRVVVENGESTVRLNANSQSEVDDEINHISEVLGETKLLRLPYQGIWKLTVYGQGGDESKYYIWDTTIIDYRYSLSDLEVKKLGTLSTDEYPDADAIKTDTDLESSISLGGFSAGGYPAALNAFGLANSNFENLEAILNVVLTKGMFLNKVALGPGLSAFTNGWNYYHDRPLDVANCPQSSRADIIAAYLTPCIAYPATSLSCSSPYGLPDDNEDREISATELKSNSFVEWTRLGGVPQPVVHCNETNCRFGEIAKAYSSEMAELEAEIRATNKSLCSDELEQDVGHYLDLYESLSALRMSSLFSPEQVLGGFGGMDGNAAMEALVKRYIKKGLNVCSGIAKGNLDSTDNDYDEIAPICHKFGADDKFDETRSLEEVLDALSDIHGLHRLTKRKFIGFGEGIDVVVQAPDPFMAGVELNDFKVPRAADYDYLAGVDENDDVKIGPFEQTIRKGLYAMQPQLRPELQLDPDTTYVSPLYFQFLTPDQYLAEYTRWNKNPDPWIKTDSANFLDSTRTHSFLGAITFNLGFEVYIETGDFYTLRKIVGPADECPLSRERFDYQFAGKTIGFCFSIDYDAAEDLHIVANSSIPILLLSQHIAESQTVELIVEIGNVEFSAYVDANKLAALTEPLNFITEAQVEETIYDSTSDQIRGAIDTNTLNEMKSIVYQLLHGFLYPYSNLDPSKGFMLDPSSINQVGLDADGTATDGSIAVTILKDVGHAK